METLFLGMLAETFVHPGMGSIGGAIDLPVAREVATDYPVIAGSSLKGAFKVKAEDEIPAGVDIGKTFGAPDQAGEILVSDARLLLLPVRTLNGSYKWATSPHLLERLARDLARAGKDCAVAGQVSVTARRYLGVGAEDSVLHLEERQFRRGGPLPDGLGTALKRLIRHQQTRGRIDGQVIVLSDDDFAWFARYGLAVAARNELKPNKSSNNLWFEETLAPDSLFYSLIIGRQAPPIQAMRTWLEGEPYVQAGGNETVGQGWFALQAV
ncbi:MAG: type III-B CRISPR module RAMP protein Cmr4 [Betaproteobacteria bacterium]|nr:type III-B CRISPR module RAMP protein Cmr4 [Betaproteobacteria bacterium]